MNEKDYITITNRVKVSFAKNALVDILSDDIVTEKELSRILVIVSKWERKLFKKIEKIL